MRPCRSMLPQGSGRWVLVSGYHYLAPTGSHFSSGQQSNPVTSSMRHLMPIVTPRLILRPPTLRDLDPIQTAKEEAWPDLQRWMSWAFDNQRSRQAMEDSIRRTMDYQNQAGTALAGFHRINGDCVVRTALDLTAEQDVYEPSRRIVEKLGFQKLRMAHN